MTQQLFRRFYDNLPIFPYVSNRASILPELSEKDLFDNYNRLIDAAEIILQEVEKSVISDLKKIGYRTDKNGMEFIKEQFVQDIEESINAVVKEIQRRNYFPYDIPDSEFKKGTLDYLVDDILYKAKNFYYPKNFDLLTDEELRDFYKKFPIFAIEYPQFASPKYIKRRISEEGIKVSQNVVDNIQVKLENEVKNIFNSLKTEIKKRELKLQGIN